MIIVYYKDKEKYILAYISGDRVIGYNLSRGKFSNIPQNYKYTFPNNSISKKCSHTCEIAFIQVFIAKIIIIANV